jgi:hypothetical protein
MVIRLGWLFFDSVEQRAKYLAWLAEQQHSGKPYRVTLKA